MGLSLNRYDKRRDKNETEIINVFRSVGISVEPIDTPCDLIIGWGGRSALVEVKTEKGGYTESQKKFLTTWRGDYITVRSVDQALKVAALFKKCHKFGVELS